MEASVDKDGCISCGLCVSTCPEVFHFDEDEKAEAVEGKILEEYADSAKECESSCPVSVIHVK